MRLGPLFLLAVVGLLASGVLVQAADCPDTAAVRAQAQILLQKGETTRAIALISKASEDLQQALWRDPSCGGPGSGPAGDNAALKEFYRLQNELARAYLKAGRDTDCIQTLAQVIDNPKSRFNIDDSDFKDDAVAGALAGTAAECRDHFKTRMRRFRSSPCAFTVDGSLAAIALPGHKGEAASCLALLRGKASPGESFAQSDIDRPAKDLCPVIARVTRKGSEVLSVIPAPIPENVEGQRQLYDPLADTSNCCNLKDLAWAPGPGGGMVRVTGGGRDCFGGTADLALDSLYRWQGNQLQRSEDNSIGFH